jgi:amidase
MPLSTAVELSARVRSGTASAVDATRAALDRIEKHNEQLGAFHVVRSKKALAEAAAVDARSDRASLPLAGVPVAIKDNIPVAGEPMRDGSAATSAEPQTTDHPIVTRLRDAGAIIIGITRAPELCVFGTTDSVFGTTRNPWNLARTSGGSSGGSAAAVASGLVALAHGNDGMGSIRGPAGNCGLVGIKPGPNVVPQQIGVDAWGGLSENGPLATTVLDAALLLSVMSGRPELGTPTEPERPLRIAIAPGRPSMLVKVDPEWVRGLAETADALRTAGHLVTEVTFPYDPNPLPMLLRWFAGTDTDATGLDLAKLDRRVRTHVRLGAFAKRHRMLGAAPVDKYRAKVEAFFSDYDLLITPTLAQPGPKAIEWHRKSWLANIWSNIRYAPYQATWNLLGWPSASVPAGWHATAGVPLGVQLVAPPHPDAGGEALILGLALQLERLRPWQRIATDFDLEAAARA